MSDVVEGAAEVEMTRRCLTTEDELLHRQVIQPWVREGRPLSNNKFEAAAKLLSRSAHDRGCQYPRAS